LAQFDAKERAKMFSIRADKQKNRLYIKLGIPGPDDQKIILSVLHKEINKLLPGFTVLSDLTEFVPVNQELGQIILQAQEAMVERGADFAVRVASSSVVRLMMERRAKSSGINSITANSLEEAEKLLDEYQSKKLP
jgi:hypothetical protein